MKKITLLFLAVLIGFGLLACKETTTTAATTQPTTQTTTGTTTGTTTHTTTGTTTTTAPETVERIVIHYFNDAVTDYADFALWIWGTGHDGSQYSFEAVDYFGAYLEIDLTSGTFSGWEGLAFIIKPADSWTGQTADFVINYAEVDNGEINVYYIAGDAGFTYVYEVPAIQNVYIHLNMTMRAIELLNVKAWGQNALGTWMDDYYVDFITEDAYGAYAIIPLGVSMRVNLGFAIIPGTNWAPIAPQVDSVDLTKANPNGDVHLYIVAGEATKTYGVPAPDIALIDIDVAYIPNITIGQGGESEISLMIDDFVRGTLIIDGVTATGDVTLTERQTHLKVDYSATSGITPNDAIYKSASAANTQGSYSYLTFIMKGSNGASIEDLKLAFRLDDNHELITVAFSALKDPDLDALSELTADYQVYVISIADTLDGLTFVGTGGNMDVAAGGSIVGFHLMADGTGTGTIEIQEVYFTSDAVTTGHGVSDFLVDNFQRTNVNAAPAGIYWCGSVGQIIGLWLTMTGGVEAAIYQFANAPVVLYENVELRLSGIAGQDVWVTPVFQDGEAVVLGTRILLSELTDNTGAVIGTLAGGFQNVVINLANSGWGATLCGLKLEVATGTVYLDYVQYKTFFEVEAAVYPTIDATDLVVFDDFNREAVGATAAYDPANPVAAANGLYYIISYTNSEVGGKLYIENDAVVFDCTTNADYINFVEASQTGNLGTHKYIVFKMKTDEGGSYDNFRFQTGSGPVVWSNSFLAAPDLSSWDSTYVSNDGWTYVVIDLELSGFLTSFEELTMYYSGSGRLLIDSIFFANDDYPRLNLGSRIVTDLFTGTAIFQAGADYAYNHIGLANNNPYNQRYLVFLIKGEGFADFRFQTYDGDDTSGVKYIGDLVGIDGFKYSLSDFSADGYRYLIVDLVASGLNLNPDGIHLHLNNASIFIAEIFFADRILPEIDETHLGEYDPATPTIIDGSASAYVYTWIDFTGSALADYLVMVVKGDLNSIRFQTISDDESVTSPVVYLNQMIGVNGVAVAYQPVSTEWQTIVIDLAASGLGTDVGALHFHYGDDSATDILTIQWMYLLAKPVVPIVDPDSIVTLLTPEQTIDATASDYTYTYFDFATHLLGQRYLILTVTGDATALRFDAIKSNAETVGVKWLWDLKGPDGNALIYSTDLARQTLVIDLVASGIGTDITALHFHYGNATNTDLIVVNSFQAGNPIDPTLAIAAAIGE